MKNDPISIMQGVSKIRSPWSEEMGNEWKHHGHQYVICMVYKADRMLKE